MNKELVKQTVKLFDTSNKWESFIELSNNRQNIRNLMFGSVRHKICNYFNEHIEEGWSFCNWNPWDYKWYLSDFGANSVCIWMWGGNIGFSNSENKNIIELLNSDKFTPLKKIFRFDGSDKCFIYVEKGNFTFGSDLDYNFNEDSLAWYIYNNQDKYVEQVIQKVEKIRKNKELTQLLRDLNKELLK